MLLFHQACYTVWIKVSVFFWLGYMCLAERVFVDNEHTLANAKSATAFNMSCDTPRDNGLLLVRCNTVLGTCVNNMAPLA